MKDPIFIVGPERSGTWLLSSLLNRHPDISIYVDSLFLGSLLKKQKELLLENDDDLAKVISEIRSLDYSGLELSEVESALRKTDRSSKSLFETLLLLKMRKDNKKRFGEKTPTNFLYIDVLLQWFPGAKIIFIYRDPRNRFCSYKHSSPGGILSCYRSTALATTLYWNNFMRIMRKRRVQLGDQFFSVKFEELITNPGPTTRAICDFLEEQFHDDMLAIDSTNSSFRDIQNKSGFRTEVLYRFRQLRKREIACVELLSGNFMVEEGYEFVLLPPLLIKFLAHVGFFSAVHASHSVYRKLRRLLSD